MTKSTSSIDIQRQRNRDQMRRARARAKGLDPAAPFVDHRQGRKPASKTPAELVKAWRQRHAAEANRLDSLYKCLWRRPGARDKWRAIAWHYGDACLACGAKDYCADHVWPLDLDGLTNTWANLQPLCRACNSAKAGTARDYRPDHGAWVVETIDGALVPQIPALRTHTHRPVVDA